MFSDEGESGLPPDLGLPQLWILPPGVNWVDAGKVELEQGSSYFGLDLPFDVTQLTILEVLLVGGAEVLRNGGALPGLLVGVPLSPPQPSTCPSTHPLTRPPRPARPRAELDLDKRVYPGGPFDPLGLAGPDKAEEKTFALKTAGAGPAQRRVPARSVRGAATMPRARSRRGRSPRLQSEGAQRFGGGGNSHPSLRAAEIKHGRLAMVAFFGYGVQAFSTGTGSILDNLSSVF